MQTLRPLQKAVYCSGHCKSTVYPFLQPFTALATKSTDCRAVVSVPAPVVQDCTYQNPAKLLVLSFSESCHSCV